MIQKNTLTIQNLSKNYKSRIVVNNVSLKVNPGEVVGLLGPNGAGKTTCFYMILGLITRDSGNIFLENEDISNLPVHARAKRGIAYLPQEPSIFRKLTVTENILAILELRKNLTTQDRKIILNSLLEEFHIKHVKNSLGLSLSGGERRRVEIARLLAIAPKYILLDEPFAGVDPISIIDIKTTISHLVQKNIGIIITDHNVRETLGICDKAYILNEGHVISEGHPDSILQDKIVKKVYLGENFTI